jgi:hypothetical protein
MRFFSHARAVRSAAFSPYGKTAITGSLDKTARLWNMATGQALGQPLVHHGATVALSPEGRMLATFTASGDYTIKGGQMGRLRDAETGQALGQPVMHHGAVVAAMFSPAARP